MKPVPRQSVSKARVLVSAGLLVAVYGFGWWSGLTYEAGQGTLSKHAPVPQANKAPGGSAATTAASGIRMAGLPAETARPKPANPALTGAPKIDVDAILADIAQQYPDETSRTTALRNLITKLGATEPAKAADLWEVMPNNAHSYTNIPQNIVKTWLLQDPTAAGAWAEKLPTGMVHDQAIQEIVKYDMRDDPIAALKFANTCTTLRLTLIRLVFANWDPKDSETAFATLESMNLTPDQKTGVVNVIRTGQPATRGSR